MDKEDIKRLAEDPRFISGIYNYCDRWCERCSFTSRCMNFAMGEEQFADPETQDLNNEAFWEKLSETFQVTLDLVKEMAEEAGIDLDSLDIEEEKEEENYKKEDILSLAMPALGCGLGRLEWRDVGPVMCRQLTQMDIPVVIYLPRERQIEERFLSPEYLLG